MYLQKQRFAIGFCTWGRIEIGKKLLKHCSELKKHVENHVENCEISIVACNSELTWDLLCIENEIDFLPFPNENLGLKFNNLFWHLAKDFDGFFHIGSDDFLHADFLIKCIEKFRKFPEKTGCIGVKDIVFYNTETKLCKRLTYQNGPTVGARFYSSNAIEKCSFPDGNFWPLQNQGLDGVGVSKLQHEGFREFVVENEFPMIVSYKTSENIWKYDQIAPESREAEMSFDWLEL